MVVLVFLDRLLAVISRLVWYISNNRKRDVGIDWRNHWGIRPRMIACWDWEARWRKDSTTFWNLTSRVSISASSCTAAVEVRRGRFKISLRTLFWILCNLILCDWAQVSQTGRPYSITGRKICLKTASLFFRFSLDLRLMRGYSCLINKLHFVDVLSTWDLKISLLSKVSPK